jgi:N-acetylmuramoyl-L-alanine amidase
MSAWSPNRRPRPAGARILVVVLHSTGGWFAGAVSWLRNRRSKVSAHFVVSRKGQVEKLVPLSDVAYHAGRAEWRGRGDVNAVSIGIEMEHFDGRQDWPPAQVQAVAWLVATLQRAYPGVAVTSHAEVARPRGRKVDPQAFPWRRLGLTGPARS